MNKFVFWNPHLPQTLQLPVWLGYANLVFAGILGIAGGIVQPWVNLLILAAAALGAFGIVNLRMWGYSLSIVAGIGYFAYYLWVYLMNDLGIGQYVKDIFLSESIISTIFRIAIIVALFHPVSRIFVKRNFSNKIP